MNGIVTAMRVFKKGLVWLTILVYISVGSVGDLASTTTDKVCP